MMCFSYLRVLTFKAHFSEALVMGTESKANQENNPIIDSRNKIKVGFPTILL